MRCVCDGAKSQRFDVVDNAYDDDNNNSNNNIDNNSNIINVIVE